MNEQDPAAFEAWVNSDSGIKWKLEHGPLLVKAIAELAFQAGIAHRDAQAKELIAAALNMVDVKGRYHSELAMNRLIEAAKAYRGSE